LDTNNLYYANQFAHEYDNRVVSGNWPGPSHVYGLIKNKIKEGDSLLDLGIGTGESSRMFSDSGLLVTGVDGSEEMLKVCAGKKIAEKLVLFNLHDSPLPFPDQSFDFAVSHALFHLLTRIGHLFPEVSRTLKNNGLFVFTFDEAAKTDGYSKIEEGIWERRTATDVLTYRHEWRYIQKLLSENNFRILEKTTYLAYTNTELKEDFYFTAVVAQNG
jgi:ubiquinone/menaquinone biosynthesis C-methylase UbiE